MWKKKNKNFRLLILAILLSLFLLHAPLIYFFKIHDFSKEMASKIKKQDLKQVIMVTLSEKEQKMPQQIVDIQKPKEEKKPKRASAQALYDSSVEKETVSGHFSKTPQQQGKQPLVDKTETPTMQSQLKQLLTVQKEDEKEKHAKLYKADEKQKDSPSFTTQIGSGENGNTDDYLPDYKIGNRTYLNTLANPNIAYYVELRRKFRFTFNPAPVLRPIMQQISRGQITVTLGVSVDEGGNLSDLIIIRSSGIFPYDLEAKRTVTASAPFSIPPKELLTADRKLHMAWTFVVYL